MTALPPTLETPPPAPAPAWAGDARADGELVLAVLAGDARAFEAIMRRHNRLLFRTARGIVDDDAEAQDVVQESYLRAFSHMAAYRGQAALATWLARIVINAALTSLRKQGRVVQIDDAADTIDSDHDQEAAMAMTPVDEAATPEALAARRQMAARLQRAIESLPPIYRSVFMLRAVEELSVEDTAAMLAVRPDAVKTRYLRARALLRAQLQAEVGAEARQAYAFAGPRCDAVVSAVMAQLLARGLIRGH